MSEDNIKISVFKDAFKYTILSTLGSADEEYLKGFGLKVEHGVSNEILGMIPRSKIDVIHADIDVKSIEVSGE